MKIPESAADLTATWLSEALGRTVTQVRVITDDTEDAKEVKGVVGQMARLSLTYDAAQTDAPSSLVAKLSAAAPAARAEYHALHVYEREVRFYEQFARQIELRTPRCYYSDIDLETGHSVLILEDLTGGRNVGKFEGCSPVETELAISEIAQFHATWWESPHLNEIDWIPPLGSAADLQDFQHLYQQRWESFLKRAGQNLPESILEIGDKLAHQFANYLRYMAQSPRTIRHDDYQPCNVFFLTQAKGDLSLAVIDWQLISLGRGVNDMAYFVIRGVSSAVRQTHEMGWLKMYHTILVENGVEGYTFDQCLHDYRMALFRGFLVSVFLIGGSNLSKAEEAGFSNVVLPRCYAAILDLNAGELLTESFEGDLCRNV